MTVRQLIDHLLALDPDAMDYDIVMEQDNDPVGSLEVDEELQMVVLYRLPSNEQRIAAKIDRLELE